MSALAYDASGRACLSGELNIYRAAALKDAFMQLLEQDKAVELDLAQVSEVDTAGLQLLLLLKREAAARDIELRVVNHSEALVDALGLLNIGAELGDPVVISSSQRHA